MRPTRRLLSLAMPLALLAFLAPAGAAEGEGAAPAEGPKAVVVEPADLVLRVEREGVVEAARRLKVRVVPEAYGGPLEVASVEKAEGPVARGEVVLRLDGARLEDDLRAARESLGQAEVRLDLLVAEETLEAGASRSRIERAEVGLAQAERALRVFEEFEGPKMIRAAELDIQGREDGIANQREELAQLEKMYEGTHLSSDTKEIVLERARRSLATAEAWLAIARRDETVVKEFRHPQRRRELKDDVRWRTEDLDRARESARIAGARKRAEVEAARTALRDAKERLAKLEADRERLTVRAPEGGILTPIGLFAGDLVRPRDPIAEVILPGRRLVRLLAAAEDLRVLEPEKKVAAAFPAYPELSMPGAVATVGLVGSQAPEGTRFPVEVALQGSHPLLRVGLRAVVRAEARIAGALSVPRGAVRIEGGRAFLTVLAARGPEVREVTIGPGDGERVQVLAGLKSGEKVLLEAPAAQPPAADRRAPAEGRPAGAISEPEPEPQPEPAPPPTPDEAYRRGLRFLLRAQNADGSWGNFSSARPYQIMLGTFASLKAFRDATTALCTLALAGPSRNDAAARAALDRGLANLLDSEPAARATGDVFYDTWTHVYVLTTLAHLHRDGRFAALRPRMAERAKVEIEVLCERQAADGGWGYYDFGYSRPTPAGRYSTSFLTAAALLAFRDARAAGFEVPPETIADGLHFLEQMRLPSGAYIYGTYAQMVPGALYNRMKGSLGRSQPCNLALFVFGRDMTREGLLAGLRELRESHHFIEMGKSRPYPHEAWYYTAGYYFLFGHYYAARVLAELEPADRADFAPWLAATLARLQDPDGSWFDFPLYGYYREYGTAFGLLVLEACAVPPARPVAVR